MAKRVDGLPTLLQYGLHCLADIKISARLKNHINDDFFSRETEKMAIKNSQDRSLHKVRLLPFVKASE